MNPNIPPNNQLGGQAGISYNSFPLGLPGLSTFQPQDIEAVIQLMAAQGQQIFSPGLIHHDEFFNNVGNPEPQHHGDK
jgi:hypothetical protein